VSVVETPAVVSTSRSYGPKVWIIFLDVAAALADATVTAGAFSAVQFVEVAVHTNEEDVQVRQEAGQFVTPGWELDDMLDDQVVAGVGEGGQAGSGGTRRRSAGASGSTRRMVRSRPGDRAACQRPRTDRRRRAGTARRVRVAALLPTSTCLNWMRR
jgi:hypothetical protein